MPSLLPESNACCVPCEDVPTIQIPGPAGDDGAAGAAGTNGVNAYTTTTANFTMPAEGATVNNVAVGSSAWMSIGQILYIQTAGWMRVSSKPTSTTVNLTNLENTANAEYTENAAPATVIASGSSVSPGGLQGPDGAAAAGGLLAANNLNDVANAATSRTNLGLGTMATQAAGAVAITGGVVGVMTNVANAATIRTDISAQQLDSELTAIAGLTSAADKLPYFTGAGTAAVADFTAAARSLVDDASVAAMRVTLGVLLPKSGLLASLLGANFNSTADQAITLHTGISKYIIRRIVVTNASISLTTAAGGVYGAAAKSAPVIVAAGQVYSALTAAAKFKDLTLEAVVGTDILTATTLYLSLTTAQGAAATADLFLYGDVVE